MAYVRDSDTSLWLHNKLGTNDLWSSHSICSQLDQELLGKIPQIFSDLQSQVKLKLILAIIHIPLRNMAEWSKELKAILVKASQDNDQWVSTLADLLRTYPDDGTLFLDPETGGFCELLNELRKLVRSRSLEQQVLPEECLYLNKSASNALLGPPPTPTKHFVIRKNPKSYQIKAEYLQKARESQNTKRSVSNSSVPIRCRGLSKLSADSPLRGIPSNRLSGSFRSPISSLNRSLSKTPNRKEPGIKLLEIGEQPIGRDAKRRKKNTEDEGFKKDEKKVDEEKKTPEEDADASTATNPSTPDYAAGLLSSMPVPSPAPSTPSYGNIPSIPKVPSSPAPKTPSHTPQYTNVQVSAQSQSTTPPALNLNQHLSTPTKYATSGQVVVTQSPAADNRPSYAASTLLSSPLAPSQVQLGTTQQSVVVQGQTYTVQTQPATYVTQQNPQQISTGQPGATYQNVVANHGTQLVQGTNGTQYVIRQAPQVIQNAGVQPVSVAQQSVQHLTQLQTQAANGSRVQRMPIRAPTLLHADQNSQLQAQPRNYSISKTQFDEVQEMFKNSNKVTRSEKALILGFIAGNRQNPCPALGDLITIVLNEEKQDVLQPDGSYQSVITQTHFEMNYATGKFDKQIRQFREGQARGLSHVIVTTQATK